jgi:hypothetical protein
MTTLILTSIKSFGLEIDEKLTIRFLKVSNSKKTVLINRGAEDGLVVGDHAKFFITSGIVARGMVEKVSPSRSIWSLYRVVAGEEIVDNKVLNLKIASPVKVTGDSSKSLKEESIPEGNDKISIPKEMDDIKESPKTSESAVIDEKMNDEDKKELEDLGVVEKKRPKVNPKVTKTEEADLGNDLPVMSSNSSRKWEVFGGISMQALTGTDDRNSSTSGSTSTSSSFTDVTVGLERYFFDTNMLKNISLFAFINKKSSETGSNAKTTSDWFEYGAGGSYHFYNSPTATNRLIGFGTAAFGVGSISIKEKTVVSNTATETPLEGTASFLYFGVGAKYYLSNNFGARMTLDYYSSKESYSMDTGSTATRTLSGPRIQVGLAYRF